VPVPRHRIAVSVEFRLNVSKSFGDCPVGGFTSNSRSGVGPLRLRIWG
jgi:hypothetical protein